MKTLILTESLDLAEARLDSERRTVRVRLIAAGLSKNRRLYSEEVLRAAAPLFEGVKSFSNHPSRSESKDRPERSVRDVTGWHENVAYENGALYATRHFTRTQAGQDSWALVEDVMAGRAPASLIGVSINAIGRGHTQAQADGDILIVEAIEAVHSADDVTSAAAGGGFVPLVASDGGDVTGEYLKRLSYEEWFEARPDYIKRVQNEMKVVRQEGAVKELALAKTQATLEKMQAVSEADRLSADLSQAQARIAALEAEREAALSKVQAKARELAVERALAGVNLKQSWKTSLRDQLLSADPAAWPAIVEVELSKARDANALPRIPIHGAGTQVGRAPFLPAPTALLPRPDENAELWLERVGRR